ncbi:MAG: porin family protein [Balneolaceae bacterium]|nr:porin family protein [Balneolaceae bacterium]
MKKRTILFTTLLALLICTQSLYGQVGIKGGVNLSKFVGADVEGAEELMGLNAGLSFSIINIGPLSIVPEVFYAEKGTRFTEQLRDLQNMNPEQPVNPQDVELEFNLAYVEIPVLAKLDLRFLSTRVVKPYIAGGPVFGFRMDCSINFTTANTERDIQDCADANFSDLQTEFDESDRGMVFGSGIHFDIPLLGALTLEARYYRGLSRLREGGENSDVYNQNFTLMLGYVLGI